MTFKTKPITKCLEIPPPLASNLRLSRPKESHNAFQTSVGKRKSRPERLRVANGAGKDVAMEKAGVVVDGADVAEATAAKALDAVSWA